MKNENQIKAIVENWALAIRNEDMAGVLKNHDKNIVLFDLTLPLQSKGIEAYKKTWELFFSWSKQSRVFDFIETKIVSDKHLAFCYGIMRCAGTNTEGIAEEFIFRSNNMPCQRSWRMAYMP